MRFVYFGMVFGFSMFNDGMRKAGVLGVLFFSEGSGVIASWRLRRLRRQP